MVISQPEVFSKSFAPSGSGSEFEASVLKGQVRIPIQGSIVCRLLGDFPNSGHRVSVEQFWTL